MRRRINITGGLIRQIEICQCNSLLIDSLFLNIALLNLVLLLKYHLLFGRLPEPQLLFVELSEGPLLVALLLEVRLVVNARVVQCVCGLVQVSTLGLFQIIELHLLLVLPMDEGRLPSLLVH